MKKNKTLWLGLIFVSPSLLGILLFTVFPFFNAIRMSFFKIRGISEPKFTGLKNFTRLLTDEDFYLSYYNTFHYIILAVPIGIALALLIAVLLKGHFRGVGLLRTFIYLPSVTPIVATALIFLALFNPATGFVNQSLRLLGINGPAWFLDPELAKITLVFMAQWGVGGPCLIFLAGLNAISPVYYEAAKIDGAGSLRQFFMITLPLLSPVILLNTIMAIIAGFQIFGQAFIITNGQTGPLKSLLFAVYFIFAGAFRRSNFGYAAAASIILFLVIFIISLTLWISRVKWVHEEN